MANDSDPLFLMLPAEFLQFGHNACLRFHHQLPSGNSDPAAKRVKPAPSVVGFEILEFSSRPFAEIDFCERRNFNQLKTEPSRDAAGSFTSSFNRTAIHCANWSLR